MDQYDIRKEGEAEEGMDLSSLSYEVYPLSDQDVTEDNPDMTFPSLPFVQLLESTQEPIVINFGSHSWQPFKCKAERIQELSDEFSCRGIQFMTMYISEAHPVDEWRMYSDIEYNQPKTVQERQRAAKLYDGFSHVCLV